MSFVAVSLPGETRASAYGASALQKSNQHDDQDQDQQQVDEAPAHGNDKPAQKPNEDENQQNGVKWIPHGRRLLFRATFVLV
jgi:hypothetical protein